MNTTPDSKLDAALGKLPRDIEPAHDLWPGIAARIGARQMRAWPHTLGNLAAAAAVIIAAVIIAWSIAPTLRSPAPATPAVANVTHGGEQDPRAFFATELARDTSLPASARDALLENLHMLDQDITRTEAAVKKYPDDVNLRALLFNLYQQQARLLDEAQRAQIQTSTRTAT